MKRSDDNKMKCYSVLLKGRLSHRPSLPFYWPESTQKTEATARKAEKMWFPQCPSERVSEFGEYYLPNF